MLKILGHNIVPQIFLGIIATKYKLIDSLQDFQEVLKGAGILFTFFSKQDEKITKKISNSFLCEYDFNQCISLSDEVKNNADLKNLVL